MYQTLNEFIEAPFGNHIGLNLEYKIKYDKYRNSNKIKLVTISIIEDRYYALIHVPSESTNLNYDVVIMFFTEEEKVKKSNTLLNYKCKFFSNSPSFIYKYAALYKAKGYLIEELYEKLDVKYSDKLPEKTNPSNDLCYDKSLFFACQYLLDHRLSCLSKLSTYLRRTSFDNFVQLIKDYENIKNIIGNKNKDKNINNKKTINNKKISEIIDEHNPLKKINLHPGAKIIKPNAKKAKIKPKSKKRPTNKTSGLKNKK